MGTSTEKETLNIPANFKKTASVFLAQALARRVLPVPGGPYRRTPFGACVKSYKSSKKR